MISFPPSIYHPVYLFVVGLFSIVYFLQSNKNIGRSKMITFGQSYDVGMFLLVVFLVLFLGLRPVSGVYFGDTATYSGIFETMQENDVILSTSDHLFDLFTYYCTKIMNVNIYFLVMESIYIGLIYIACRKLTGRNSAVLVLLCLTSLSFYAYGVNGLRNGLACSIIILALTFIEGKLVEKVFCALLCVMAANFHHSTLLPIICMVFAYMFRNPKLMYIIWLSSFILSLAIGNSAAEVLTGLGFDDRLTTYINENDKETLSYFSKVGFRWDFLLYSIVPIAIGWYAIFKRGFYDKTFLLLLGTYMYANAFWIIVIRAPYSNRFAYLSWFLYPIVLGYPLVKWPIWRTNNVKKTGYVILLNFLFTFFMWIIS
ncbi:EpsG family protein [Prevotella sp. kh1p2]|uniref:EpsG family protein n=1 Tax=Prevotella sp. kh1p2 TaxID=1761883 RepID=UPI0008D0D110|nr:EpsG family protein [Prevotella sp. kh1p2]SET10987.1 EpsG family protein [Prevotella sp. kh1p2]SNU11834.1 EpsG family protein [Prevotellaceae bacterium KH2P17]